LEAPALHTLRLIARHCVTSLRSAHWLASSLKLAARCHVSGCWPSCSVHLFWNGTTTSHRASTSTRWHLQCIRL